ncbi:MAG TPA: MoxR family ATPase, partial [Chroococcales cyanobacterium]
PADITGTDIIEEDATSGHRRWTFVQGPLFGNIILADEINRTPPKTQSALLEAMEERQITLDGRTERLPDLFMVVATQNPIEFEGTYPLPEAQLDRFMFKVLISYPGSDAEKLMLTNWQAGHYKRQAPPMVPVTTAEEIVECRNLLDEIKVEESVISYLVELVTRSRGLSDLHLGASPRAALSWLAAAKAHAAIEGKDFVTPDNIKFVSEPVLRHRIILTAEAELDGVTLSQVIANLLRQIPVPR